jgi:hypothetical protein
VLLSRSRTTYPYVAADIVYNGFNNGFGIASLHLIGKYVEFGVIEGPVLDRWVQAGTRSKILGAIDLSINSRWVGLGSVGIGAPKAELAPQNGLQSADGGVVVHGKATPREFQPERWLPYVSDNRTRTQATIRHVYHYIIHYIATDILMTLIWLATDTIGNPNPVEGSMTKLVESYGFVLLPLHFPTLAPNWLIFIMVELGVGAYVWQAISCGYHFFAALAVGLGIYEVEAWEIDHFDAPWKADSLLDMWGKRWHQMFRVSFHLEYWLMRASFPPTLNIRSSPIRPSPKPPSRSSPHLLLLRDPPRNGSAIDGPRTLHHTHDHLLLRVRSWLSNGSRV